ncbi:MAG: Carbonic anhydrase, gamma class, partial [uncultured Acidimicrobiales bacterium]
AALRVRGQAPDRPPGGVRGPHCHPRRRRGRRGRGVGLVRGCAAGRLLAGGRPRRRQRAGRLRAARPARHAVRDRPRGDRGPPVRRARRHGRRGGPRRQRVHRPRRRHHRCEVDGRRPLARRCGGRHPGRGARRRLTRRREAGPGGDPGGVVGADEPAGVPGAGAAPPPRRGAGRV